MSPTLSSLRRRARIGMCRPHSTRRRVSHAISGILRLLTPEALHVPDRDLRRPGWVRNQPAALSTPCAGRSDLPSFQACERKLGAGVALCR